jgi:hypothetical protein
MTGIPTYQPYCLSPSPYAVYYTPSPPGGAPYQQPHPQAQTTQYFTYDTVNVSQSQPAGDPGKALLAMISPKEEKEGKHNIEEKAATTTAEAATISKVASTPSQKQAPRLKSIDGSPIDESSDHVKAILALLSPLKDDGSPAKPPIGNIAAAVDTVGKAESPTAAKTIPTPPSVKGKARNIVVEQIKSPVKTLKTKETEGPGQDVTDSVDVDFDKTTDSETDEPKGLVSDVQPLSKRPAEFVAAKAKEEDVNVLLSRLSIPGNKSKLNRTPSDTESDLDSSRSGASPKSGTPKRSRIAAKFNVPIETDRMN